MLRNCIRRDFFLSFNSASFINLLEPVLQVFILEEITVIFSSQLAFVPSPEYSLIIISIGSFKIKYLSSFSALGLLVLHQNLGNVKVSFSLTSRELKGRSKGLGDSWIIAPQFLMILVEFTRITQEFFFHFLELGCYNDFPLFGIHTHPDFLIKF